MQLSHQRGSNGNKRERKRTYPKSNALDVEKWVISPRCPWKKGKEEKLDSKVAPAKADEEDDDDCAMSAHVPLEKRWGDIEL